MTKDALKCQDTENETVEEKFQVNVTHCGGVVDRDRGADQSVKAVDQEQLNDAQEIAEWQKLVEENPFHWRKYVHYRQNMNGLMFYIGGESGQYMRITIDGTLNLGTYDLAHLGIENAVLTSRFAKMTDSYEQAFILALYFGGQPFMTGIREELGSPDTTDTQG